MSSRSCTTRWAINERLAPKGWSIYITFIGIYCCPFIFCWTVMLMFIAIYWWKEEWIKQLYEKLIWSLNPEGWDLKMNSYLNVVDLRSQKPSWPRSYGSWIKIYRVFVQSSPTTSKDGSSIHAGVIDTTYLW